MVFVTVRFEYTEQFLTVGAAWGDVACDDERSACPKPGRMPCGRLGGVGCPPCWFVFAVWLCGGCGVQAGAYRPRLQAQGCNTVTQAGLYVRFRPPC